MTKQKYCYCGSRRSFDDCCEPYILGKRQAPSPEHLMRSRYSAYATAQYPYILDTYAQASRSGLSVQSLAAHDNATHWKRLEVVKAHSNEVEFKAYYVNQGEYFCMHERSCFTKENEHWRYVSGQIQGDSGKLDIGRNTLCPCGSAKKFKRCCA